MGNSPSSAQGAVFRGFDTAPPRDQRPLFAQLLAAADEARSTRRAAYLHLQSLSNHVYNNRILRSQKSSASIQPESPRSTANAPGDETSEGYNPSASDEGDDAGPQPSPVDVEFDLLEEPEPVSAQAALGFVRRPPVPPELREVAMKLLRGDLSDDVFKLVDRTVIRLFISSTASDTEWERNTLVKDVWPYLAKLCQILDLDFEPIDLKWNAFDASVHENKEWDRSGYWVTEAMESSVGPSFFSILGDMYGQPGIPTSIAAEDFETMTAHLRSNNRSRDVSELLDVWYALDNNATPPVYVLRPVHSIMPAFARSTPGSDPASHAEALTAWIELRERLAALLRAGAVALGQNGMALRYGCSLTEREVLMAQSMKASTGPENFYGFQRTLLDIKRKAGENPSLSNTYIDMIGNQIDKEAAQELAKLRSRVRANRFYAVPWRNEVGGLAPDNDKVHGQYLRSFCDDAARILAESILRHYSNRPFTREWDPLAGEVVRHAVGIRQLTSVFRGRETILKEVREFLDNPNQQVMVVYGPSGVGKSSILGKAAEYVAAAQPQATLVYRFIGTTPDSSDSRSILRSICSQLARARGLAELKLKVSSVIEAAESSVAAELAAATGEPSVEALLGDLDSWPPTSYEGLQAAFPVALGMADYMKPIVLILDALDEISEDDDARDLTWLPDSLPAFVKLIVSTAPPKSQKLPTLTILRAIYPDITDESVDPALPNSRAVYFEVPALTDDDVSQILNHLQLLDKRTLTESQRAQLVAKATSSRMPLYIHTAWRLVASKWSSTDTSISSGRRLDSETVPGILEDILDNVEHRLGSAFVSKALGYLTAARQGLSHAELSDVLSCDEDVLTEVFQGFEPPIRRIPPILVVRLFEELKGCLVERQFYGVNACFWSHRQFKRVAEDRYLFRDRAIAIHSALADYWEGKWAKTPKLYYNSVSKAQKTALRYIMDQSLLISGKPNTRRLASLVWHQLESGVTGFQEAARTLQDIGHLAACADARLLSDLLASYRSALSRESAEALLLPQLVDYYRFLLGSADILSTNPNRLVSLAANLYQGSAVASDARRWISMNAGSSFKWLEWQNRPMARGEPIATLRGSDGPGGSPLDSLVVTGRDTHGERVAIVGVRMFDGRAGAVLFDTAEIRASGTGGGTARLLARIVVSFAPSRNSVVDDEDSQDQGNQEEQDEEVPLTCAFSRRGDQVAIAGRSLLVVGGFDFGRRGVGHDPDLPPGDVITAIAWTKGDGCIVTASDGEEPGRLVLWDADSFALLRVIRTQYPRQPVAASYATLGFWDEYRSLFILLDVDELAEDAESGLSLQYIPCKAHTDPPPDGKSRFAIAHRAPHVLIASDDGKGYVLIDFKAKRPIARMTMDVDNVHQVALSHDGRKVAVVPSENKVIFVLGLQMRDSSSTNANGPKSAEHQLGGFRHLGTVLGVDPSTVEAAGTAPSCVFSRSGNTILTDGDFGSIKVWDVNELGDHSTLRFKTLLPTLPQGLVPVASPSGSNTVGWAVTEGSVTVSLADARGRSRVRSHRIAVSMSKRNQTAFRRDMVLGIATHPARPLMGVVTDLGNLCLLSVDKLPDEPATWVGALLSSAFGRGIRDDEKVLTFNVRQAGSQAGPTCITFTPSSSWATLDAASMPGSVTANGAPTTGQPGGGPTKADILTFATGHEDGSISVWEWFPGLDPLDLSPRLTLRLNAGRVTSLVPCNTGERTMAFTIDDSAVVVWDGSSDDPETAMVLIPPKDYVKEEDHNRRSVSSVRSSVSSFRQRPRSVETIASAVPGAPPPRVWNQDRPCPVAFARTRSHLLATGGTKDGTITIWNTEAKVKRNLLTVGSQDILPIPPVMAIAWSVDDATIVSISEDKHICIHNTVTGHLIWVHDLWMVKPRLNVAAFSLAGRHLGVIDHDGEFTSVQLNGDWPTAATASSPTAASPGSAAFSVSFLASPTRPRFPPPPEPEFVTMSEWDPSVSVRVVRRRTEKGTRSSDSWQRSTGSGMHGHVALLELSEDLPRGTYEVLCEVEFSAEKAAPQFIPLKFVCGPEDDEANPKDGNAMAAGGSDRDPQLDAVRGFTRLLPVDEQKSLAGQGVVTVRLGYLKALCKLDACYIDLKRIPGPGDAPSFGKVHFIPVDPRLYTPEYRPPKELEEAFDNTAKAFEQFENLSRRRRASIQHALQQGPHGSADKEGAAVTGHGSESAAASSTADEAAASTPSSEASTPTPLNAASHSSAATEGKKKRPLSRQMTSLVSDVVGGLLTAVVPGPKQPPQKANLSMEEIQREMDEARQRAREQAAKYEEEEERKAAAEAEERQKLAWRVANERAERERERRERSSTSSSATGEMLPGWGGMDFGDDAWELEEAQRMLKKLEETAMKVEDAERMLAMSPRSGSIETGAEGPEGAGDSSATAPDATDSVAVERAGVRSVAEGADAQTATADANAGDADKAAAAMLVSTPAAVDADDADGADASVEGVASTSGPSLTEAKPASKEHTEENKVELCEKEGASAPADAV
ncbi:hypothetical protein DFJ73DRAFT_812542 [Zopfochytrium polystomum]|nr:hypothetical protein DFJ73DRAFT_812542 [Zopfochytrium polystomum]